MMNKVITGLERLEPSSMLGESLGLLMHPASIDRYFKTAFQRMAASGLNIRALFGPQHGIMGETQDNMIEWEGYEDKNAGIPVYSLYGKHRTPTRAMLYGLDRLVIDLQDVGARYYTFIWSMLNCMRACSQEGIPVSVLDRPNPIGTEEVQGPVLDMKYKSFVGLAPIPVQHGMTIGELALYFNLHFELNCDLEVVPMEGYQRSMIFSDTGLPWVFPSPNMPSLNTALVYPGGCLLEATNLSEGRGTTLPFELFGAPFIEHNKLSKRLEAYGFEGVAFREVEFMPTFHKWKDQLCKGYHIHVTDRKKYRSFDVMACILAEIKKLYPREFLWNGPPYEYEWNLMPIDILAGHSELRLRIDEEKPMLAWLKEKDEEAKVFRKSVEGVLIYE
ncbi:MAG: hypothetical protein CSA81_09315 [Acidobacteria bacterium]|nr:MAG: hypothetical protein CSA81_09315 [Acidobacteriota bacterium]